VTTAEAGWYPDPSGRYNLRYFDGATWTSHVTDASGAVIQDNAAAAAPPAAATTEVPAYGSAPTYGGPSSTFNDRSGLRMAATIIAALGFVAVLLGMVLDVEWLVPEGGGSGLSLSDLRDNGGGGTFDTFDGFLDGGWIAVVVFSGLAAVGAWLRGPFRWVGLGLAIAGLVYTGAAVGEVLEDIDGIELGNGAAVAMLGLVAGIVGTAISRKPVP
jgi:hypothetical protein